MAGKRSFVWTYLEEDGHLRRYAHDSCSSTQECHVGSRKWRIKEGPITTTVEAYLSLDAPGLVHLRSLKDFTILSQDLSISVLKTKDFSAFAQDLPGLVPSKL